MNQPISWPKWPQYGEDELMAISRVLTSNQLFAAKEVQSLERQFAKYQGTEFAVGVGNATQGLHLALAALNIGQGDEVIVTPCTWISSASCILMQNAIPIFCDIENETLGLDPNLLEEQITSRTKAIVLVHILGYPAKVKEILEIATRYSIPLVEDASHAPGATIDGKMVGSHGDLSVISFQQRKAISTGDGGIVTTNNWALAEKVRRLRSFGDEELSYNYRMSEFAASLGKLGLSKLDEQNLLREKNAHYLSSLFSNDDWIRIRIEQRNNVRAVYYAVAIDLNISDEKSALLLERLLNAGFPVRKMFSPLNHHPHFRSWPVPARGLPWKHPEYNGKMKHSSYEDLNLPVAAEYCNGRILELYVHPPTSSTQLDSFTDSLRKNYHELVTNNRDRRISW